jgi:O-antigen/teichoic acid export membrane protein
MGPIYRVLAQENRLSQLEDAYGMSIRWMAMLHLPIGVALAWNRHDLLALVGPQFTAGSTALAILAVGFALCMCYGTGAYLLMLSGRGTLETKNAAIGAVVNVLLAAVLVPAFGLAGAAASTLAGFVLVNALRIWEIRRFVGVRTFRGRFLRVSAVSGGSATLIFAVLQFAGVFQQPDPISLGLRLVVMTVLQVAVLWRFGLSRDDKEAVNRLLRSTVSGPSPQRTA